MKKTILLLCAALLFLFITPAVFAESDDSESLLDTDDYDNLFGEDDDTDDEEKKDEEKSNVLNNLIGNEKLDISASFSVYAGYSPGINTLDSPEYNNLFLLALNSNLALNFMIADNFKVFQRYVISYPDIEVKISEFFADYSLKDILLFRVGLQKIRWGESKNFPYTNLPSRMPDDYNLDMKDIAFRLTIPAGIGGIDFLAATKLGYWEQDSYPGPEAVGFGIKWNLVLPPFDMNLGAFYRHTNNFRAFASVKTTLFKNVETYAEALISVDPDMETTTLADGKVDNPVDFAANLGIYTDFADKKIEIGTEFWYNGEETELKSYSSNFPLLRGSNVCLYAALKAGKNNFFRIFSHCRYNIELNSLYIIPGMTIKVSNNLTLSAAGAILLGDRDKGYFLVNPDPLDREAFTVIRLIFSGSI